MAVVKPFICIRPAKENAAKIAALPYDVYNRKEACAATLAAFSFAGLIHIKGFTTATFFSF